MNNTTNLFVEILIIGFGALACIVLAFFDIYYISPEVFKLENLNMSFSIIFLFSTCYVLGIAWDRLIDFLTAPISIGLQKRVFAGSEEYHLAKDLVYTKSEGLTHLFEYLRSRMRICRAWMLNWFLIAILSPNVLYKYYHEKNNFSISVFVSLILFLLSILTFVSWKSLLNSYYKRLLETYNNKELLFK